MGYAFCQKLLVLPRGFFTPNDTHFLYVHGITPSPLMGKLIHLNFRKNTTPFSPNNPAPPPRIKVSAREARRFPHAVGRRIYTTWQKDLLRELDDVRFD